MPKRNLVWIAIAAVIALLLWRVPETFIRRDALLNQFSPLLDVRLQIQRNYVEKVEDKVLLRGAIDGMLNRLDPYSAYFDENEFTQFEKQTEGQFEGVGIEVGPSPVGGLMVVSPIEGSPAFYAGLRTGDRILEIDGHKTENLLLSDGVRLIVGSPGTSVTLTMFRPSSGETFTKTVTRSVITVRTVRGWARTENWDWDYLIDPERRIAYVRISSFEGRTAAQLDTALKELLSHGDLRGLIIDVRDNPGGLLEVVVEIANRFIGKGMIVYTRDRQGVEKPYLAARDRMLPYFPIVVLVNHGSASASEILSGALRDHKRATVVGEQTFGKGSVQTLVELEGHAGALKLTTAYYYLPNGERIHGRGITPDRVVKLTTQERAMLQEAQLAVYSTSINSPASQPASAPTTAVATSTAPTTFVAPPANAEGIPATAPTLISIDIAVDRQLQEALKILRQQLATRAAA
jgi:carboxyl-terminal processing protease